LEFGPLGMFGRTLALFAVLAALLLFNAALAVSQGTGNLKKDEAPRERASGALAWADALHSFTENVGQVRDRAIRLYFTSGQFHAGFVESGVLMRWGPEAGSGDVQPASVRVSFDKANPVLPEGREEFSHRSNFFIGNSPEEWRTQGRNYEQVVYPNLYDGIDLVYRVENGMLKYEFLVLPRVDPGAIRITYDGIRGLELDGLGDLVLHTLHGDLRDTAPKAFQGNEIVACKFRVEHPASAGFECPSRDPSLPLVIDPLLYSTFLGGGDYECCAAIALDGGGNVYVSGTTQSVNFPTTAGAFDETYDGGSDAFVVKLDAAGTDIVYATFIGGTGGDGGEDLIVDGLGNVYLTGYTYSWDFPTTPGAFQSSYVLNGDGFVAKLNASGSALLYSTYLGGGDYDSPSSIDVDSAGSAYVTGTTISGDFPTTPGTLDPTWNGGYEAFIAKLNAAGSALQYSTFLGGSADDWGTSIDVDSAGRVHAAGETGSTDFPTTVGAYDRSWNGDFDAFVTKLDSSGATPCIFHVPGGAGSDIAYGIAVHSDGSAFVGGQTDSNDFPTTPGALDRTINRTDAFVTKVNPTGSALAYSTFLGGTGLDRAFAVAVMGDGTAVVTGGTYSADFPTTPGAFQHDLHDFEDAYVARLGAAGDALRYSTLIGGNATASEYATGIAVDGAANAYLTGMTVSVDFPTTPGAYDRSWNGDSDAFVAKVATDSYPIDLSTSPAGLKVRLDGVEFTGPSVTWCARGTPNVLDAPSPQGTGTTRSLFSSWSDGGAQSHDIVCNAPASYAAMFVVGHQVTVNTSPSGLQVTVDGATATAPQTYWWPQGSVHSLDVPSPQGSGTERNVFASWSDGGAKNHDVTVTTPATHVAAFTYELRLTVSTTPAGLTVIVDGIPAVAPRDYWWTLTSIHTLDTMSPQQTGDTRYLFASWSDGEAMNHSVAVIASDVFTANFLTEFRVTVATDPPGLQVIADVVAATAPQSYWWPSGTVHSLSTPTPQALGGTRYSFTSWSDGGSRTHSVVASSPATYTAAFVITDYRVTISTNPSSLDLLVDGIDRLSPASFWWAADSLHEISTYSPQGVGATRYVFASWSDGGAQTHSVKADGPKTIRADFGIEYIVVVTTFPAGRSLIVDGVSVPTPQTYWWPPGSTHSLDVSSPQEVGDTRFVFDSWSDGGAMNHSVVVTAPATHTASFVTEFRMTVATAPSGLQIIADGVIATAPQSYWWSSGSNHTLDVPSPQGTGSTRMGFRAWSDSGPRSRTVVVSGPASFTALFELVHLVMITSSPGNMLILVDGLVVTTPQTYWWADGSNHSLDVPSPQGIGDTRFVFSSWSDGGAQNRTIRVVGPADYSASLGTEHRTTLSTSPPALRVSVDGVPQDSPYAIWCLEGSTRTLDVPSPQEAASVRYRFASWSDGGAQAHVIVCDAPRSHVATFAASDYWIVVTTLPLGLEVVVDGVTSLAPASFWCVRSSVHTLDVASPQGSGAVRQLFSSWSDGGPRSHPVTCDAPMTHIATFVTGYEVVVTTSPPGLATVVDAVLVSAPQTYWWPEGSIHNLNASTPQGTGETRHAFISWSDGGSRSHDIVVTGAATFVASFQAESLVTISTLPSELDVIVDGVRVTSPQAYWWVSGSLHELEAPSLQGAGATRPAFDSWSDGGARVHRVTIAAPQSFIASYVLAHEVVLATQPPGLGVLADGTPRPEPYYFRCVADSSYTIGAPSPQPFPEVTYAFDSWSDGGAQFRTVVCDAPATHVARFVEAPLGDFGLRAEPTEVAASSGGVVEVLVTVFGLDGLQGGSVEVSVADAPAGVSGTCAPSAVTPPQSCLMTLVIAPTVPRGSYAVVLQGTSGLRQRQVSVTLVVLDASQGDFRLAVVPPALWIRVGETVDVTVTVTAWNGFSGEVRLRVLGFPVGVSAWLSPNALVGSGTSVLRLSLDRSLGATVFLLAVEGESDGPTHLASLELRVRSETPGLPVVAWFWMLLLGIAVCLGLVAMHIRRLRRREGKPRGRMSRIRPRDTAPQSAQADEETGGPDQD